MRKTLLTVVILTGCFDEDYERDVAEMVRDAEKSITGLEESEALYEELERVGGRD